MVSGKSILYTDARGKQRERKRFCDNCGKVTPVRYMQHRREAPFHLGVGLFAFLFTWPFALAPTEEYRCGLCGRRL